MTDLFTELAENHMPSLFSVSQTKE